MALLLDIRRVLREGPAHGEESFDFSAREFDGFGMEGPVRFGWQAKPLGDAVQLSFTLAGTAAAGCARCLAPFTQPLEVAGSYDIHPDELKGAYTEYPAGGDGEVDLEELAYGEVVMAAPISWLCREDCPGLCPACGRPKGGCACESAQTEAPAGDPRWQALRDLLEPEDKD